MTTKSCIHTLTRVEFAWQCDGCGVNEHPEKTIHMRCVKCGKDYCNENCAQGDTKTTSQTNNRRIVSVPRRVPPLSNGRGKKQARSNTKSSQKKKPPSKPKKGRKRKRAQPQPQPQQLAQPAHRSRCERTLLSVMERRSGSKRQRVEGPVVVYVNCALNHHAHGTEAGCDPYSRAAVNDLLTEADGDRAFLSELQQRQSIRANSAYARTADFLAKEFQTILNRIGTYDVTFFRGGCKGVSMSALKALQHNKKSEGNPVRDNSNRETLDQLMDFGALLPTGVTWKPAVGTDNVCGKFLIKGEHEKTFVTLLVTFNQELGPAACCRVNSQTMITGPNVWGVGISLGRKPAK